MLALKDSEKKAERDFWHEFRTFHPTLLSVLCDAAAAAMRQHNTIRSPAVRMVGFHSFRNGRREGYLVSSRGAFLKAYEANRQEVNQSAVRFFTPRPSSKAVS